MKNIFLFLLFLMSFLNAEKINLYNVDLKIKPNGNLIVTELINYDFENNKRHGILRFIPYNDRIKINVLNIEMDNKKIKYKISDNKNKLVLKIGNPNELITGDHFFKIKYEVSGTVLRKDDKNNIISWNAIGTGWKIYIYNPKIIIHLPDKLKTAIIKGYYGYLGSKRELSIKKINNLTYETELLKLKPKEGITIDIIFDRHLIPAHTTFKDLIFKISYYVSLIIYMIIIPYFLYILYKNNIRTYVKHIVPQYYPLKDFNVLKTGLIIDQYADVEDFSAAILELVSRGYIKITDNGKVLAKLKEPDNNLEEEYKRLLKILFPTGNVLKLNEISKTSANIKLEKLNNLNNYLYEWGKEKGYFRENPSNARLKWFFKMFLIMLPFLIILGLSAIYDYKLHENEVIEFVKISTIFITMSIMLVLPIFLKIKDIFKKSLLRIIIIGLYIFLLKLIGISPLNPFVVIFVIISILVIVSNNINLYTNKGLETLKYLLGFKKFILTVEKNKIERFLEKDPTYMDKILPYALLFGANHWFEFYQELSDKINNNVNKNYLLAPELSKYLRNTIYNRSSTDNGNINSGIGGSVGSGSGGGGGSSW